MANLDRIGNGRITNVDKYVQPDVKIFASHSDIDPNAYAKMKARARDSPNPKKKPRRKSSSRGGKKVDIKALVDDAIESPKKSGGNKLPKAPKSDKEKKVKKDKKKKKKKDGKSSKKSKKKDKKPKEVEDDYVDEVEDVLPILPPAPVMLSSSGFAVYRNDKSVEELREELSEVSKRLKSIESETSNELAEMQKDVDEKKKKLKKDFGKQIDAAKKSNQKEDKKIKKENDESQKIVEGLREENKKLREQKGRYPKQIKEVLASNESLKKANEEVAGHFKSLSTFSKKLQKDHNRLVRSSDECRNKYLPRYRTELRERKDYIAVETKVKNLYRDAMIRICNRVVQTRDPQLIEDVSTTAIEVEGELNPSFDPKILFENEENESDADSDSDYDSDSDSDSDSD